MKMETLKDFRDVGNWTVGQGGEGYEITREQSEQLEESAEISDFYYDQEGRYVAEDIDGETEYFYIITD